MTSLSASIFSALLASASPTPGSIPQNETYLSVYGVKNTVEHCLLLREWMNMNFFHENLQKNIKDFWLFPILENVFWVFHGSKQEFFMMAIPIIEQSTYEMQVQIQENKGFFQVSKEHWQELSDIANNEQKEWKERLIAAIRLISIINFFTLLVGVYGITIFNAYKGRKTPSILFWWFTISNGLGATGLFLAGTPLEWSGYAIATIAAAITFFLLRKNEAEEKNNLLDKDFIEHMQQHTAFSVYDLKGKALLFSPKLLEILGYTKEEVFVYQREKGEIVTLFYPDIEERERINAYLSELKEKGQAYEATFFPRRKDGKKIALHFNTIPRKNKKGEVIGTFRFAEDVTRDHRDNIDLLTGASDKKGFEKRFHTLLTKRKTRWIDQIQTWSLSIIYSDLDSFKGINDTYNHDNADVILKEFANMARRHFREEDLIARFWGDEFGVICDNSNRKMILSKLNSLRDEFSRSTFEIISGHLIEKWCIVHDSYNETLKYQERRNSEIKKEMEAKWLIYDRFIHCCIGGVGVTGGVTDFTYEAYSSEEQDTPQKLIILKKQAERVMNLIKYLEFLGIEGVNISKNGVGMPIFDIYWQEMIGVEIHNRTGQVSINRETLARAPEFIAEGVKRATANR